MPSERVQRQIDRLLDEAEEALGTGDWAVVRLRAEAVLRLDGENGDARTYLAAASDDASSKVEVASLPPIPQPIAAPTQPTSFANGRYVVRRFLGEGGKKKVYLAHDSLLDRDVAFALIKTEGLDDAGRLRIEREAQAMGRLGNHPNIVTVYDIGDENGQPYLVLPILSGGDVEGVVEKAPDHKLPLEQAIRIAIETCQGLELAHGKGIVHRDLKPGNVWLTEDGRAMIGDFGLAVAADRSRLTQAGMMVGTVSYMPPEQAMGGEITPRSDLYSLGAMLYEMVCGRPPFVGDESVAIIGQHLNTPPVAPTWHRPDCPPALETLILRLLEKDPARRPSSATEVREALESARPLRVGLVPARDASVAQNTPSADNPLYRRTFVGRENEVKQLQQAFDAAISGQGGLVMVVGEPGIGKTAICEQLATYVALRGGKALVGHCYEEGSLSLPYLAFVEAMRSYVLAREPDGLRSDLGTGAADVARIVSEVRDRVQGVELRPTGDPEDDRWRLLQAITGFLRNASAVQPLCIVLEDLHWADRGTLDLLLHVSRNLQGARLLIVGNYRDVEVDRTHPLSGTLAELSRGAAYSRIRLRGLTVNEVGRMMSNIRGQDVPWSRAEALHRQTEGNPLFVQEVLRYLVEEGLVVHEDGRYMRTDGEAPDAGIPEGLRDVIGKRLSRLSPECNRLLAIAAVIGRDFRLDVLQRVAALPEDDVIGSLEEAKATAVVEERVSVGVVTYRFSHAFFSQTLYEETSAPRRIRLHQQVARALEEIHSRRLDDRAAELAEHFSHSSDSADLSKAVRYGEMAAKRAMTVFDYGEAARLLERALDVQEVLDPDDIAKRCDLLLALGEALMPAGESSRAFEEMAEQALPLAEALGDESRAARVACLALDGMFRWGGAPATATSAWQRWSKIADRYAAPETEQRIYADFSLSQTMFAAGNYRVAQVLIARAISLARSLNANEALMRISGLYTAGQWPARLGAERLELAEEISRLTGGDINAAFASQGLLTAARTFLSHGLRTRSEETAARLRELAERTRNPSSILIAKMLDALLQCASGQFEEAVETGELLVSIGEEMDMSIMARNLARASTMYALVRLGQVDSPLMLPFQAQTGFIAQHALAYAVEAVRLAYLGYGSEAQELLGRVMADYDIVRQAEETPLPILAALLEGALLLEDRPVVAQLASLIRDVPPLAMAAPNFFSCHNRLLGDAAAMFDKLDEARAHYAEAIEICGRAQFRPEIALTRLSLAELLLVHYPDERDTAIGHLDFAIGEFQAMKMQPALERALGHRGLLKA